MQNIAGGKWGDWFCSIWGKGEHWKKSLFINITLRKLFSLLQWIKFFKAHFAKFSYFAFPIMLRGIFISKAYYLLMYCCIYIWSVHAICTILLGMILDSVEVIHAYLIPSISMLVTNKCFWFLDSWVGDENCYAKISKCRTEESIWR